MLFPVGVTGFEPATTRPPDAYSNRAELHPELRMQRECFIRNKQTFSAIISSNFKIQFDCQEKARWVTRGLSHRFAIKIQQFVDFFL